MTLKYDYIKDYTQEYKLAEAAYLQGNYEKAATIIDVLVSKFEDDPSVRLLRGHIYCYGLYQYEIGKKEYEAVIHLTTDPEFIQFANSGLEYIKSYLMNQVVENTSSHPLVDKSDAHYHETTLVNSMPKSSIFSKINQSIDNLLTSVTIKEPENAKPEIDDPRNNRSTTEQIQQLEFYLDNLVVALNRGELPVNLKKVTQVFDSLVTSDRLSIDVPADKFVDLYNDLPNILTGYAIGATLSDESYREPDISQITFHRLDRGTYWIFPTARIGKQGAAWLVPNPLKDIKIDRNKSLNFSFDLNSSNQNNNTIIILEKPALVKIIPNSDRLTWKLTERGHIRTSSNVSGSSIASTSSTELREIAALKIDLEKLKIEYQNNQLQQNKNNQYLIHSMKTFVSESMAKIQPVSTTKRPETIEAEVISRSPVPKPKQKPNSPPSTTPSEPIVNNLISPFAKLYNAGEKDFLRSYMVSTASLMKNNNLKVELVEDNIGHYWIIPFSSSTHYLVPKMNFRNYDKCLEALSLLFDGANDSSNFTLFKPAIVTITKPSMPKQWKLEQKGYLESR